MSQLRTVGVVLIIIGIIAFCYAGVVKFRTPERVIDAGPIHVTATKTHTVYLPPTLGAICLIGGVVLLVASNKRT